MTKQLFDPKNKTQVAQLLMDLEPKIYKRLSYLIGNSHDANDLTQEVLIRIYTNIDKIDLTQCKVETWVYRVVKNISIDYFRKIKPVERLGEEYIFIPSNEDIERKYELSEFGLNVGTAIKDLPPHYRKAFVLRYLEEKSLKEISDKLSLPVNTIKCHIHRAKLALQNRLSDYSVAS